MPPATDNLACSVLDARAGNSSQWRLVQMSGSSADKKSMCSDATLDLDAGDVLRVLHVADQSLRANDWVYAQNRLSMTDVLGRFDDLSLSAYYDNVDPPAAAIAAFVARSQNAPNPDHWLWCIDVLRRVGLDAIDIANAAVLRSRPGVPGWDDVPMSIMSLFPGAYRLVPLTLVPYGHAPGQCKYDPYASGNSEHAQTVARLKLGNPRRLRDRITKPPEPDYVVAAWKDIQGRVQSGQLPPCSLHTPPVDWNLIHHAALDLLARTPATVRGGVKKWDFAVADAFNREETKSYPWPSTMNCDPQRMNVVLRSLFRVPITWQPGNPCVENGQHRICGLRESGATHAFLVDTTVEAQLERAYDAVVP